MNTPTTGSKKKKNVVRRSKKSKEKAFKAQFLAAGRIAPTVYSRSLNAPRQFDTIVRTIGRWQGNVTDNNATGQIFTNSLLTTAWTTSANISSSALSNLGRNYTKYRVMAYSIKYSFCSRSTSNYLMWVLHTPTAPSVTAAASWSLQTFGTLDRTRSFLVPGTTTGSPTAHFDQRDHYKLIDIVGRDEYAEDDSYAGTLSTSGVPTDPADLTYCTFTSALVSGSAQTASNSPDLYFELTQYVSFYDPRI